MDRDSKAQLIKIREEGDTSMKEAIDQNQQKHIVELEYNNEEVKLKLKEWKDDEVNSWKQLRGAILAVSNSTWQ